MNPGGPLVFTAVAYDRLGAEVCRLGGFEAGEIERRRFPDGERYQRIASACGDRDAVLIGGTISDAATLEIYDLACGLVECGARSLTLVIPYFGYSTMERAVQGGEVVTAKARARLLSSIPRAWAGNRVFLIDLHAAGVAHYFEGDLRPTHLYAKPVIKALVRRLGGDEFVLACTDAGRAKWVESLANDLGVTAAFAYKRRLAPDRTEISGVSAHVRDRTVIIYDDMIRTGSSLLGAARAYADAGASRLAVVTTHGVFPGDAAARIEAAGLLSAIACTDTHPRAVELADGSAFIQVDSVAPMLVDRLKEDWR